MIIHAQATQTSSSWNVAPSHGPGIEGTKIFRNRVNEPEKDTLRPKLIGSRFRVPGSRVTTY